jgi:hypothetical protein
VRACVLVGLVLALAPVAACKDGDGAGPSGGSAAPGSSATPPADVGPPVSATFIDLKADAPATPVIVTPCTEAVVTPVRGTAIASGAQLAQGDVAAIRGQITIPIKGDGTVLVARARLTSCDAPPARSVVKADAAKDLSFMHGSMHAWLDLDDRDVAPSFYFGRLSGTAAVPEHAHAGTWELLCAVDASGTFTLSGTPSHLGAHTCVTVPPDTKHSWQPDEGSTLTALQMYWPTGPEQRFKKLAADELAAGSADAGKGKGPPAATRDH